MSKEKDELRIWECPECGAITNWTYADLADFGSPVCDDCDCEMELLDEK